MGRGRMKGKKLSVSQDDPGSGEEEKVPLQKRRGRPQKPLKDDIDEDETQKIDEDSEDATTTGVPNKDVKNKTVIQNGKKRKRNAQANEKVDSLKEEIGNGTKSSVEESKISNGFRQNRRKNKPRRAAEAGLECN